MPSRERRARESFVDDGAKKLISVAESVERVVRRAGFPAEERPFKPHLTLSRIEPTRSVADVLTAQAPLDVEMAVTELALVRSELGKGPAQYRTIERFPLGKTD